MLEIISKGLSVFSEWLWGIPLIVLILSTGLFLSIRLKGLQFRKIGTAFRLMFAKNPNAKHGEISSFGALCTQLSATIGTGNIVGVATAIAAGGPGALFWMWIAALVGMATKYAECLLAVRYRKVCDDGHVVGGPFYYIELGMGRKFKWLAVMFAVFGMCAGLLGIGTFAQVNGIANAVENFVGKTDANSISFAGMQYSIPVIITAIVITILVALVLIGGIKRISSVTQVIVPFMAITYIIFALIIMVCNADKIPGAFATIIESAFGLKAVAGGALGAMFLAMRQGIARGIFSNEAGLGSAPIAAAAAQTNEPAKEGLVSMLGTFIDTIIVCTMTGLSIVITGAWDMGLEGVDVTIKAFQLGLPFGDKVASFVLMVCLVFFAFTTILGWNYYSERCLEYLTRGNRKPVIVFRVLYILCVFVGPFLSISMVWTIADIFNGFMAIPNLVALVALSGVVVKETKRYLDSHKKAGN